MYGNFHLIAAVDLNYGIGKENKLLFQNQHSDLQHFKDVTMGNTVVMGRKTFESIGMKPLYGRRNVVISSTLNDGDYDGVEICRTIEDVFNICKDDKKVFIIGGEQIYRSFVNFCNVVHLTIIHTTKEADSFFPRFNQDKEFYSVNGGLFPSDSKNEFPYSFKTYYRIK